MEEVFVAIVGVGPAGLATSACLNHLSIPNIVLEKEDCSASMWKKRTFVRKKLHLAKYFCELPYKPFPSGSPTFLPRIDFINYLENYEYEFGINPKHNRFVESASYDKNDKMWLIRAKNTASNVDEVYFAQYIVVATGENSEAVIPKVPGLDGFEGEYLHSSKYKIGGKFCGKDVLVVGCGNSAMEIAYDLANWGAYISVVVRSPVFPAIKSINGKEVTFENGKIEQFDAIIFATGFKSTVRNWLKDGEDLFNEYGMPKESRPNQWKGENGLYCAGFFRRGLHGISVDAKNKAKDISLALSRN